MDFFNSVFSEFANKPIFSVSNWFLPNSVNDEKTSITADLFCPKCAMVKTFIGKYHNRNTVIAILEQMVQKMINDNTRKMFLQYEDNVTDDDLKYLTYSISLKVDDIVVVKLSCPTCGNTNYIAFVVESKEREYKEGKDTDYRTHFRVHKIGEYPSQDTNRLMPLNKYLSRFPAEYKLLVKSVKAYQLELGTGAMAYIRKAYESLLFGILDNNGIERPRTFKDTLKIANDAAHIVPPVLTDKAYGLFGEMSDVIHGDTDDDVGLSKYEDLRDVFLLILDYIIEQERVIERAARIRPDKPQSGSNNG